jgi:hypothetical protein
MVLHIESYQSRREAARLEARHRAADINVGLVPILNRNSYRQFNRGDRYSFWVAGITALAAD